MTTEPCTLCRQDPYVRNNFLRECVVADCPHRGLARQWDNPVRAIHERGEPTVARLFDDYGTVEP